MKAETLEGHLDGMLLATLESGPRHGYALLETLQAGGQFELPAGIVYPALRCLERAGLIQGTWAEAAGRRRRVYQLTPAGRRMLDAERGGLRQFSAAVTALMQPVARPVTP